MTIANGQTISAADFVGSSSGASDSGKVTKLDANGRIGRAFIYGSFGGTGADGALSITSGSTVLSFGSANVLEKNYTSISITGTGALGFSNPATNGSIAILKSTGNVTITSSATRAIDLRLMGGANNQNGFGTMMYPTVGISPGLTSITPAVNAFTTGLGTRASATHAGHAVNVFAAAGGQDGNQNGSTAVKGTGGFGGGGLLIECGGALNITGTIDASGQNGTAATGSGTGSGFFVNGASAGGGQQDGTVGVAAPSSATGATGGAGGGGGAVVILYLTLTADSGTYTIAAGTHGTSSGTAGTSGDGGVGYAYRGLVTAIA